MTFLDSPPVAPPASEVPARFSVVPGRQIAEVFRSDAQLRPGVEPEKAAALAAPMRVARAAVVRCSFPGCRAGFKAEVGWVVKVLVGDSRFGEEPVVMYVAPRGHKLNGAGVFVETERAKKQRHRGHTKRAGNEAHRATGDLLAAPLLPNELPALSWAIERGGWLVKCPFCRGSRFIRITKGSAAASLISFR